jgi:hypothetical protein
MAFSDFLSIEQVLQRYPLKIGQKRFLPEVEADLPDWLLDNLKFSLDHKSVDENEVFFTENFIYPFIHQAWKKHQKLKVWSHRAISYDSELYGEPDYLIATVVNEVTDRLIKKPLLAVTEAKKEDFTKGWGQCLAEMIACQKINGREKLVIYGIVSTGLVWEFGKLDGNVFTKHALSYSINEPKKLFGLLNYIFSACEKEAAKSRSNGHKKITKAKNKK